MVALAVGAVVCTMVTLISLMFGSLCGDGKKEHWETFKAGLLFGVVFGAFAAVFG
jgi:hypothetical protein